MYYWMDGWMDIATCTVKFQYKYIEILVCISQSHFYKIERQEKRHIK